MILVYVDDVLIVSKKNKYIDIFVKSLKNGLEKIDLMDEGDITRYLRVEIQKNDGSFELKQPFLIKCILEK